MFFSRAACLEMPIHVVGAGEKSLKIVHPDRHGDRKPDRRPERIAPANPVPELEHVLRIDAELRRLLLVGGKRDEMFCNRGGSPVARKSQSFAVFAFVSVSCVVNVFEAMMKSVVSGASALSVSAICVPSTFETKWMRNPA